MQGRLTYANGMATLAVVIAVAGGTWAIGAIPDSQGRINACYVPRDVTRTVTVRGQRVRQVVKRKGAVRLLVTGTRCARGESKLTWNQQGPAGAPGTPGAPGQPGTPGEPATKLFAFIREPGGASPAVVQYGSGVTGVSDPVDPNGPYTVSFNQSLVNCVVQAVPGSGDPPGGVYSVVAIPSVFMSSSGDSSQVDINFRSSGGPTETSFMIAAFC